MSRFLLALITAYMLLAASWFVADPIGAAPDEPQHYLKTIALGRGDWFGSPSSYFLFNTGTPLAIATTKKLTRSYFMPAALAVPPAWLCMAEQRNSARCVYQRPRYPMSSVAQPSYVARYQPYPYILPALLSKLATDRDTALMLARFGIALSAVPFLLAALLLLWDGSLLSELGLVVALTPMVMFTSVVLSPSGPEIAAAICVLACIIRMSQQRPLPQLFWAILMISGVMLAAARALGVLWIVLDVAVMIWLVGMPRLKSHLALYRRPALITLISIGGAMLASVGWQLAVPAVGFPIPHFELTAFVDAVFNVPEVFAETIGIFGWQDTVMPRFCYALWGLISIGMLIAAMRRGTNRERKLVDALLLASGLLTVLLSVAVLIPSGYAMQGRYMLPFGVAVPMVAGEVVRRRRAHFNAASGL